MTQIRVRYAPSPTGLQHIGGLRTALFNYLFARSQGGTFILRLEDTDRTRFDQSFVKNLYDTFAWLGIAWDEGPDRGGPAAPYIQSERTELYRLYAQQLLDSGKAYYCFCSACRLEELRVAREAAHASETGYDRHCRALSVPEAAARVAAGEPHVIRLKIPLGERTEFTDRLLGSIAWNNDDVNPDPVLLKSDGFPTYHLANVVDDHCMGITHVLRAQEWLSSTPLHIMLYRAFGWTIPEFCHLPMVLGQDGKKLSKRHGSTSLDEFRRNGYVPQALINYVALLGASYKEGTDLYSLDELAQNFNPDKLNKAPAVFDYKKLEWYNARYIRMNSDDALASLALPFAQAEGLFGELGASPTPDQKALLSAAMPLIRERVSFLAEIPAKIRYLFIDPVIPAPEEFFPKKATLQTTIALLSLAQTMVPPLASFDEDTASEQFVKETAQRAGVKLGDLMMPLRVAITGSRISPPLFASIRLLGQTKSCAYVNRALSYLCAVSATE
ncbi:MAG: glutamate--tRNA ligase [Spirochaetaceae bacterium]|jgi:glutamyl-tRNA synthetase|nr:glutamate--tRNA ligase [Spirochaetaceae bacterium]